MLSAVFESIEPKTNEEKQEFVITHNIALWDVIESCDIDGSADNSIKNVVPTDLGKIFSVADIKKVFVNGKTAEKFYNKYHRQKLGIEAICLPSTSPANAMWSLERLTEEWKIIRQY